MSALDDIDAEELWNNSKGLLIPGMAGGAAGAGLGTYLTSRKKKGETPSERRKRVLRNAMIGATAGTTAGAAIPAGVNLLGEASRTGAFTDTVEDLIADSAILGAGGVAGLAGGTWAKDRVLTQASESTRVNTEVRELYNNMSHGTKAKSIVQFTPKLKPGELHGVEKMLETLQQGSRANTQEFFDDAIRKTEGKFRTQFRDQALKHFKSQYQHLVANSAMTDYQASAYAKQDLTDLMKKDSVKTTISIKAEDSVRRAMQDIGLTMPEEDISDFFKRLADPKRWANRSDFLKRMIGLKGSGEVGKIWGGVPTDSGRWKSLGRRLVKGSFPAVGLAAGGLLASNFI